MADGNAEGAVTLNQDEQRYELPTPEGPAFLTFAREGGRLLLLHTEVPSALEGRGIGSRLVRGVLEQARADGARVVPLCPFVRAYLRRHPDYDDVAQESA